MTAEQGSEKSADTLPRIWYTRIMTDINAGVEVDTVFAKNEREARLRYSKHYQLWEPDPEGNQPLRLRFDGDTAIKTSLIDAFYAGSVAIFQSDWNARSAGHTYPASAANCLNTLAPSFPN